MDSIKSGTSSIKKAYNVSLQSLKNHPVLFLPFVIFAIFDFVALILLFLSPRMPLRLIFGPPIRTFWGEQFLHYPTNFLLLPKLASLSKMFLSIFLGSLLTAVAVVIIFNIYNKKHINLTLVFKSVFKKYISLCAIVFIFTFLFYVLIKITTIGLAKYFIAGHKKLLFWGQDLWLGPILLGLNFIFAILIQSAFIYAIPILIIEKERLIKSIAGSFWLFKKLFVPTLILVGLPMITYLPIVIMQQNSAILINKLFPETILLLSIAGIIISSLVIDLAVTTSTTFLYFLHKEEK